MHIKKLQDGTYVGMEKVKGTSETTPFVFTGETQNEVIEKAYKFKFAQSGGKATLKKHGKKHFTDLNNKRWKK